MDIKSCEKNGLMTRDEKKYHLPAHRVPIVVAWMVTKTQASVLWLRRPAWRRCLSDASVKHRQTRDAYSCRRQYYLRARCY